MNKYFFLNKCMAMLIPILFVTGCDIGGFNTIPSPDNDIVYTKNESASRDLDEDARQSDALELPLPELDGSPEIDVEAFEVRAAQKRDVNVPPYNASARLTFRKGVLPYYCSAQFIGKLGVVLTAAHCLYDNGWNNSFRVHNKYHSGSTSASFDWECAAFFSGWTKEKYKWDYAFVKVRGAGANTMSLSHSNNPSEAESIGYPSNLESGQILQGVVGKIIRGGPHKNIMAMQGNPFGGGSSGGAWHNNGNVISVNSHIYKTKPNVMFAPVFDGNVTKLYEFVEQGCPEESVHSGRYEKLQLEKGKGVVQSTSNLFSWAPTLNMKETQDCGCGAEGIYLVNELDKNYEIKLEFRSFNEVESRIDTQIAKAGESRFLGCGVPQKEGKDCQKPIVVSLRSAARILERRTEHSFTSITFGDPSFCALKCKSDKPDGYCLRLGGGAAAIAKSLSGFINEDLRRDPNNQGVVSTVPEMVATFGGNPDEFEDPCGRSDFISNGVEIENSGIGCRVSVKTENPLDLTFSLVNPSLVVGTPQLESLATFFENRGNAPQIEFLGNNGSQVTSLYGGKVVAVSDIDSSLIITTENGCLVTEKFYE